MATTTLFPGDIAIVGFNFDNPDEFAFTPLVDIGENTEINFTDNGWQTAGTFRTTEGTFTWVAPTDIAAGTIINPTISSILFSTSGDQIIAYQGDSSNPAFLYALNSEGNPGVWQSDSTSSNNSALPTGLVNGETAIALKEIDNAIYTGITSGTQAELLAAISKNSNWSGSNSTRQTMTTKPFKLSGSGGVITPLISEFRPNPTGTDPTRTTFELSGTSGDSFEGWIVSIESDLPGGTIDRAAAVSGTFDSNGLLTVDVPDLENPSFTVVFSSDFTGNIGDKVDPNEDGEVDNPSIFGTVFDAIGVPDHTGDQALLYGANLGGTDFTFTGDEPRLIFRDGSVGSLYAINDPDNSQVFDVNRNNVTPVIFDTDPTIGTDTFGTINPSVDDGGNEEPTLASIYNIQGAGHTSTLKYKVVTTTGIVTGDFQNGDADHTRNLRGFYMQDETGDGDLTTSDGIFVFEYSLIADVNVGDKVQVTGIVNEFFDETQIKAGKIEVIGSGLVVPTNVDLPSVSTVVNSDGELIADLEQYEGMLVNFPETLTVIETFNLDRFGELRVSEGGRLQQFTNVNAPSVSGFEAHLENVASRTITIDDGLKVQNPDPIIYPAPGLNSDNTLRMGDTVTGLTGNVRFSRGSSGFGDETFRIMPTEIPNFVEENVRPETPEDVGGRLKVASLNVLNYFTTLDEDGNTSGPNNLLPRGADNQTEFERQQEKLVTAITDINADIFGLVELENTDIINGEDVILKNLVDAVNTKLDKEVYDYIPTGFIGGDAIKVGIIYKPTEVTPVNNFAILDSSVDSNFRDDRNRPALAQTFEEKETGAQFTIAVNHFKSKRSSGIPGDTSDSNLDQEDGQGFWNAVRTDAAIALTNWLATDPTGSGDDDFLIVGDLNAYAQEDPITGIEAAGYTNLATELIGPDAYSFVFDGQAGTLDYALANSSLTSQVTGVTEWHINADEPDAFDYNLDFGRSPHIFNGEDPFRTSDHDPIIVGLNLES